MTDVEGHINMYDIVELIQFLVRAKGNKGVGYIGTLQAVATAQHANRRLDLYKPVLSLLLLLSRSNLLSTPAFPS